MFEMFVLREKEKTFSSSFYYSREAAELYLPIKSIHKVVGGKLFSLLVHPKLKFNNRIN